MINRIKCWLTGHQWAYFPGFRACHKCFSIQTKNYEVKIGWKKERR